MTILEIIRRNLGQSLEFSKGLNLYNEANALLSENKQDLDILAKQHNVTKNEFSKAIQAYPKKSKDFNKRYNDSFSDYIKEVGKLKDSILSQEDLIEFCLGATQGLTEYIELINKLDLLDVVEDYKYKEYLKNGLGILREDLPQISYKDNNKILRALSNEKITINKVSIPVNLLKPSQTDFDHSKIQSILRDGMDDKDFVPFISKDLHIIDGHHRWASELEKDESLIIDAYLINLDAKVLIDKIKDFNKTIQKSIDIIKLSMGSDLSESQDQLIKGSISQLI